MAGSATTTSSPWCERCSRSASRPTWPPRTSRPSSSATRRTTRRFSFSSTTRSASRMCGVSPGACRARRSTSRGAPPAPASPSWRSTFSPDGLARLMEWLAYPAIGVIVGFFAGLLGIGGGVVLVPLLVLVFRAQGLPDEHVLHIALGTGLAVMAFTSVSSMRAHHAHGSVDWKIARAMSPGMLAGSFGAALIAGLIPTKPLAIAFTVLVFYAATQILLDLKPPGSRDLPSGPGLFGAGTLIGALSSLVAAGGAFLTIPFPVWGQVPIRRAIGPPAATWPPHAVAGTAGYVLHGLRAQGLPSPSVGYAYLPAPALVGVTCMLPPPLGARLAHRLPVKHLRTLFPVF